MAKDDKRGLASADEKTRQRVASEGGKSSHGRKGDKESGNQDTEEGMNEPTRGNEQEYFSEVTGLGNRGTDQDRRGRMTDMDEDEEDK